MINISKKYDSFRNATFAIVDYHVVWEEINIWHRNTLRGNKNFMAKVDEIKIANIM